MSRVQIAIERNREHAWKVDDMEGERLARQVYSEK